MLDSDWKRRASEVFENYRSQMLMRDIMQYVLDQTLVGMGTIGSRSKVPESAESAESLERSGSSEVAGDEANTRIRITSKPVEPPVLIASIGSYNMVRYKDKYIGVPHSLGAIDLTLHDLDEFPYVYESQNELEVKLKKIEEDTPKPEDPPVLVGSIDNYNIVHFRDKYIGLSQSLGPIDLTQHDLDEFPYVYESRNELEARLAEAGEDLPDHNDQDKISVLTSVAYAMRRMAGWIFDMR
jgi:hypothetical protein